MSDTTSTTVTSTGSGAARLDFIDGLRGLAMLMVLLFHTWTFGGNWKLLLPLGSHSVDIGSVFKLGSTGVSLFLALSGFCLYWPFVSGKRAEPTLWEFAKKRAHRILPPYYIALVIFAAWEYVRMNYLGAGPAPQDRPDPTASFLMHVFMIHNLRPGYFYDINGSFWSLALESQLYVLFPLLVEAFRRWNKHLIVVAVLLGTLVFRYIALRTTHMEALPETDTLTYSVFGRAFEFTLGMFAAWRVAEYRRGERLLRMADVALIAVPLALALIASARGYGEVVKATVTGCVYVGLLLSAVSPRSIVHKILSAKWIVTMGVISYSVYLIHHPFAAMIGGTAYMAGWSNLKLIALGIFVTIPAALGVGALFFRFCEKPFLNARAKKKVTPAPNPPANLPTPPPSPATATPVTEARL